MGKDVIIACDFASTDKCLEFLEKLGEARPYLKIGMELYYAEGPEIVRRLKARGHKIFLDLKLHDIPNTVKKAMMVLNGLDVDMCNVHVAGTVKMMEAAKEGFAGKIIGVTQLTSTSQQELEKEILVKKTMYETVLAYAEMAAEAGLEGVVCSPLEAGIVHEACGEDFLTVTPGVRFEGDKKGGQHRVTTPAKAKSLGSDYIVVGRSITGAADPLKAYEKCCEEFIG